MTIGEVIPYIIAQSVVIGSKVVCHLFVCHIIIHSCTPIHGSKIDNLQYFGYSSYVIAISTGGSTIKSATIPEALHAPFMFPCITFPYLHYY